MVHLPAAVRCFTLPLSRKLRRGLRRPRGWRSLPLGARVLILDTETRVDLAQAMIFGGFRIYEHVGTGYVLVHEGIILGDVLSEAEANIVLQCASAQRLPTYARESFIRDVFLPEVYGRGTLCVGFNLPFDLFRLATRWSSCRKRGWKHGFTLYLLDSKWQPPIHVKALDSKRSFIEFGTSRGYERHECRGHGVFPGRFVDLRTLAFSLTGVGHTLESACKAMGFHYEKREIEHGIVTTDNLLYNGEDLGATQALFIATAGEWTKHPFVPLPGPPPAPGSLPSALPELDPNAFVITRAFSPASLGKAYLRAMGIRPSLVHHAQFPKELLGYAMAAYYGGRSECHIRRKITPVTYCDVLSMYPSVCVLMQLWSFVVAEHIDVHGATADAQSLLERLTLDDLYRPEIWSQFHVLVELEPDADVLPLRTQYLENGDCQIGLNVLRTNHGLALYYMLPDLLASRLLTGKAPRIRRAWRFSPVGIQEGLQPIKLLGEVDVHPGSDDFFRTLIEKRHLFKQAKKEAEVAGDEVRARYLHNLQLGLKILANATAYGIFAEIDERVTGAVEAEVHGLRHFRSKIAKEEHPGPYMFPPLAALITSAARLLLAMVECELTANSATFAFCDTDSMAVVGPAETVQAVRERFAQLTPYAFGGDLLEVEEENVPTPLTTKDSQLYCLAISAKRYVLFNVADDGSIVIRKYSEHGLGHLVPPPGYDEKQWMEALWIAIIRWERGEVADPADALPFAGLPAVGRFPISKPSLLKLFDRPAGKNRKLGPSRLEVRPFNFMLVAFPDTGNIATGGEAYPTGLCQHQGIISTGCPRPNLPCRFRSLCPLVVPIRPIAPYERSPEKWRRLRWVDLHSGKPVSLSWTREATFLETTTVRVQTYRDVVRRHLTHPEAKAAGPDGQPCGSNTLGELQRLHVCVTGAGHIGKESHELEEVQAWLTPPSSTYTHYIDEEIEWQRDREVLRRAPRTLLAKLSGRHVRSIQEALNTDRRPHLKNRAILHEIAEDLRRQGVKNPPPKARHGRVSAAGQGANSHESGKVHGSPIHP